MSVDRSSEPHASAPRPAATLIDGRFSPRQLIIAGTLATGHLALFAWGLSLLP